MKKYISVILAIVVIGGAIGIFSVLKNRQKAVPVERSIKLPLAFVQDVSNSSMPLTIPASGRLTAKNKIELLSEVQGVLQYSEKEFKPGVRFSKGEVLYQLNNEEFSTNLLAQKSSFMNLIVSLMPDLRLDFPDSFEQWQDYLDAFDIHQSLQPLPEAKSDKEKRFISAKNINTSFYTIKNLEIKRDKYAIYAPFDGVLTEANVTPGSLVSPGQVIGEFVDPSVYEMEVSVNSNLISRLAVGDKVSVKNLENSSLTYTGEIARINAKVDVYSQTVNLFINLSGPQLKEGLYLKAFLQTQEMDDVFEMPRNLLVNETQVYAVKDSLLQLVDIRMIHQTDQRVLVRGLSNNQTVLVRPVPKAFDGMKVAITYEND
jgi:multidrug efflux pump subunit AcrA (membrane-fusion protein)